MIEYFYVWLTLWLGRSDNTKFMIGSLSCMVTWCSIVKLSVSTKAHRSRAASQKETAYLWMMAEPCSKILKACVAIHL